VSLDHLIEQEEEPGLGNGGLGRLASCFMDSLASLEVPAIGYGIRYEFGIFDQAILDGWQVEVTDKWLRFGTRGKSTPRDRLRRPFGGTPRPGPTSEAGTGSAGFPRPSSRASPTTPRFWATASAPATGCGSGRPKRWSRSILTRSTRDYYQAVEDKMFSENITKVLYPNDEVLQGKTLRLQQQFFFVTCALQDMLRVHVLLKRPLDRFHEKWTIQLNDTHPAIAVAELMRLLVDVHEMDWDTAWRVTRRACAYTTTRSCRKRWRSGRCRCLARCCRATWRSYMKSTAASSRGAGPVSRRRRRVAACR